MELSVLIKKDPDGTYVAISPTVPECISRGKSPKEALDAHRRRIRPFVARGSDSFPDCIEFHVIGGS
jgi:hypothetical protein